jgi:hypothetical protein
MTTAGGENLRDRLRRALPAAIKARDRPALTALRSAVAAIDNAEAVNPPQTSPGTIDSGIASGTRHAATPGVGTGPPASPGTGAEHPAIPGTGTGHPASAGAEAKVLLSHLATT